MSELPLYQPLNVEIPASVITEVKDLAPALLSERQAASEAYFFAPPFEIVSQTDLDRVTRGDYDINGRFHLDQRELPCAHGFSLTEIPGNKPTRNGQFIYRGTLRGKWVWRTQMLSHIPEIKAFVESLPFTDIDIVRIIMLPAHGVHVPHYDSPGQGLANAGHVTLSFVIAPGEKTKALIDDKIVDLAAPAYFFQDHNAWGMVAGEETAFVLKVCGWMDADKLEALFAS
jgi:hypothetical protein